MEERPDLIFNLPTCAKKVETYGQLIHTPHPNKTTSFVPNLLRMGVFVRDKTQNGLYEVLVLIFVLYSLGVFE